MEQSLDKSAILGSIRADEAYPLSLFKRLLGLNEDAMRKARRAGLKTRRVGRRRYIIGSEAIEFLRQCPEV